MPPLKIVILTDLHINEPWMPVSRLIDIVRAANNLQPDLIVLLGDYLPNFYMRVVPASKWSEALAKLRAPLGVYGVAGNHDWWEGEGIHSVRWAFRNAKEGLETGR
jgi:predicted MPP superfamily phosphohydrolase